MRQTPAERSLEPCVAALGLPYRCQFPCFLGFNPLTGDDAPGLPYFPDFVIPSLALVIEVDDESHATDKKAADDLLRTQRLAEAYGWRVVRISNADALQQPAAALTEALESAGIEVPRQPKRRSGRGSRAGSSRRRSTGRA